MLWKIIFLVIAIQVCLNADEIFTSNCFRLEGTDIKVDIGFSNQATFVPRKMHVELGTTERPLQSGKSYPRTQYTAVRTKDSCAGASFVFPNIFTPPDRRLLIELVFSYGIDANALFDRHETYVGNKFSETTIISYGLKGATRTAIKFSPELKTFPISSLRVGQALCLEFFNLGRRLIFLFGEYVFSKEKAYEGYQVAFSIGKPLKNEESSQVFYARSIGCDRSALRVNNIYTDPSTQKVEIEVSGPLGNTLRAVYEKTNAGFVLKENESTTKLEPIVIISKPPTNERKSDIIYLYPLDVMTISCSSKYWFSYTQLLTSNGVVMRRTGAMIDYSRVQTGIVPLKPATKDEIDACLEKSQQK